MEYEILTRHKESLETRYREIEKKLTSKRKDLEKAKYEYDKAERYFKEIRESSKAVRETNLEDATKLKDNKYAIAEKIREEAMVLEHELKKQLLRIDLTDDMLYQDILSEYQRKSYNFVKECTDIKEYREEYNTGYDEIIFCTVPKHRIQKIDDDKLIDVMLCDVTDLLNTIWRINNQITFHNSSFSWKLVRQIRYKDGILYFLLKLPVYNVPTNKVVDGAIANTCINLDIDWDWVKRCGKMPESLVLFDADTDKDLRIKINDFWLSCTPAHIDYQRFLEKEENRIKLNKRIR